MKKKHILQGKIYVIFFVFFTKTTEKSVFSLTFYFHLFFRKKPGGAMEDRLGKVGFEPTKKRFQQSYNLTPLATQPLSPFWLHFALQNAPSFFFKFINPFVKSEKVTYKRCGQLWVFQLCVIFLFQRSLHYRYYLYSLSFYSFWSFFVFLFF